MNVRIISVMARFGTFSSIIGAIMILFSVSLTPGWGLSQPLSDLGSEGFGSVIYNSGLLMTGSLAMLYAAGLFEFTKDDIVGQLGSLAFLLFSGSICILGIAIADIENIHNQVAYLLFFMIPTSATLISYNLYKRGLSRYAVLGLISLIFGLIPWLMGGPVDSVKELTALIPFSIWQIALGVYLYRLNE